MWRPAGPYFTGAPLPTARPRYVWVFIAANLALFAALTLSGDAQNPIVLIRFGANYAPLVREGEYWRLFTANFLHGNLAHVGFNTYALYTLGNQVEALYGSRRFVVIYLLAGMAGSITSYGLTHGLSVGASTSLFGLFAAMVIFFYRQRELLGPLSRQQLTNLAILLLINFLIGITPGSRIDNWGHAGGFIGGLIVSWLLCPRYRRRDPIESILVGVTQSARSELANDYFADANSLKSQALPLALFVLGLATAVSLINLVRG